MFVAKSLHKGAKKIDEHRKDTHPKDTHSFVLSAELDPTPMRGLHPQLLKTPRPSVLLNGLQGPLQVIT